MSDATCPACGRSDFKSEVGMKIHHVEVHGESIADSVALICEHCGDEYLRHPNHVKDSRFCSTQCQFAWAREHGDLPESKYDPREQALRRDDHTCQRCGDAVGGKQHAVPDAEVHHLIPRAAGGPDVVENLVTLCSVCHKRVHNTLNQIHETRPDLLDELRDVVCDDE